MGTKKSTLQRFHSQLDRQRTALKRLAERNFQLRHQSRTSTGTGLSGDALVTDPSVSDHFQIGKSKSVQNDPRRYICSHFIRHFAHIGPVLGQMSMQVHAEILFPHKGRSRRLPPVPIKPGRPIFNRGPPLDWGRGSTVFGTRVALHHLPSKLPVAK
jgi:hypothetical protein